MAKPRLSVRKIKEVLRLSYELHLSDRQVAQSANVSRSTVKEYRVRAERAGINWTVAEALSEKQIEQRLFPPKPLNASTPKALPDFDYIYRELKAHKKFNLTLDLLWREYKEQYPDGYQYSHFCELYRQ
jgi:transposase